MGRETAGKASVGERVLGSGGDEGVRERVEVCG